MPAHAIDAPTADDLGLEHPHARHVAQELTTIADVGVRHEHAAMGHYDREHYVAVPPWADEIPLSSCVKRYHNCGPV